MYLITFKITTKKNCNTTISLCQVTATISSDSKVRDYIVGHHHTIRALIVTIATLLEMATVSVMILTEQTDNSSRNRNVPLHSPGGSTMQCSAAGEIFCIWHHLFTYGSRCMSISNRQSKLFQPTCPALPAPQTRN